jgi:hypothetical protein
MKSLKLGGAVSSGGDDGHDHKRRKRSLEVSLEGQGVKVSAEGPVILSRTKREMAKDDPMKKVSLRNFDFHIFCYFW